MSDQNFTIKLLQHLRSTYCIDDQRIYANGLSDGGGFINTLACSSSGSDFAAFAPVAGAFENNITTRNCTPSRTPLPILEFHGLNDTVIPYYGNTSKTGDPVPPISQWLLGWAQRNCLNPTISEDDRKNGTADITYSRITYSCEGLPDIVEHYRLNETEHVWPSTSQPHTSWVDASPLILDFFRKHSQASSVGDEI